MAMNVSWFNRLAMIVVLAASAFGQQNGFVTSRGREIVDPEGRPLLLRGINLGNWLVPEGYMFKFDSATSPRLINNVLSELIGPDATREFWRKYRDNYITREDIRFIRNAGLNSIRVPFNWRLFAIDDDSTIWTGPGFEMLDRVVGWCKEEGLWVILDMHCAPGGQTGDNIDDGWGYPFLFEDRVSQERTIQLWQKIAERYCHEKTIIGYDLLNEPIAHYFDQSKLNPLLEPLYKRITSAIRAVDRDHILFLGGAQWNTNFGAFGAPFDSNVVYTFHKYWCDTTQAMIQDYVNFGMRYNVPIWMGESGENKNEWIAGWRRLQEKNKIGWCFWPYKKMAAPSCMVTFDRPKGWEAIMKYANGARSSFASIRSARISADLVKQSLTDFIEQCNFRNCRTNVDFLKALGLEVGH
jgi:endoglucanase